MLTQTLTDRWRLAAPADAGSRQLREIAEQRGTPFFLMLSSLMQSRMATLREALPGDLQVFYSVKANPNLGVVAQMARLADGCDVASAAEIELALAAGARGDSLSMTGPGKSDEDLVAAAGAGALVVLESVDEGRRLARLASAARPRVALRVNPPFELAAESRMGGGPRKFGVDSEIAGAALRELAALPLAFEGLHIYAGSSCLDGQAIADAMRATLALAIDLAPLAPAPLAVLNLGGGFGIPCFPGERPLDLAPIGDALATLSSEAARRLPGVGLRIELGRYLVGEAGIYVSRVLERKLSRGHAYLILQGGLNHHWHATGALEGRRHLHFPLWVVGGAARPTTPVTVCGPLCAPHDTWAENLSLPDAAPGDLVVVFQSGAYAAGASPQDFMLRPRPQELLA